MKKLLLGTILLALVLVFPTPAMAGVNVGISISLPPIVFAGPPEMVVIPETDVYAVPDVDVDIFFYHGWWWRPWEGRWYRSRNYDSGWAYYQRAPSFYGRVPSGWRNDYRNHRWQGHPWNYQRIPNQQLQQNWSTWEQSRHWEKQNTWGVQGLKPRSRPQQPSQTVQPRSQAKPQVRETTKPQQARQPSQAVQPRSQAKPQVQKAARQQQSRPQSVKAQQQHSQQQHQKTPQQSKPQQGKSERGQEDKQDRN